MMLYKCASGDVKRNRKRQLQAIIISCLLVAGLFSSSWFSLPTSRGLSESWQVRHETADLLNDVKKSRPVSGKLKSECCQEAKRRKLEDLCSSSSSSSSSNKPNNNISDDLHTTCHCIDYMLCRLIVVTALSSNHFFESFDFFGSLHSHLPDTKVIVYDLGLTESEADTIMSYCNVLEVRRFDFDRYPPHTTDLFVYAWKPHVCDEISKEHDVILYCDVSCRINPRFTPHLPHLFEFPVLARIYQDNRPITATTHEGMIEYLLPNLSPAMIAKAMPRHFEASAILFLSNRAMRKRFMRHWVDCARKTNCIAPEGSKLAPCNWSEPVFAGCHRYDQSALNLILFRELSSTGLRRLFESSNSELFRINKYASVDYDNEKSTECGILYNFNFHY